MAARTLDVLIKVKDAATAALNKISNKFKEVGKSVRGTGVDFTEFNRIMFSTSAFVGMFTSAFRKVNEVLIEGAQVDRVTTQFENAFGPKGKFFNAMSSLTDNSIDRMEAMRSGIALKSLGIASSMEQVADIVSQAGTAAKLAGHDSAEGIKKYTEFLKTGSIASLSFLNIIAETNPALQAQMAVLHKAGGVMGKVITTQQKLAIGAALLRSATEGQMQGFRDLLDVMRDAGQAFFFLRAELGKFLGAAFGPLIEKLTKAVFGLTDLIERIRKTDKEFVSFIKNLFTAAGAITGVVASLGIARLMFKALGALGIGGLPFLALSVTTLAAAFSNLDEGLDRVGKMFKLFGGAVTGTFQLMASFLNNTDNASRGIGRMDSALHDMLDQAGLLGFVTNLARAGIIAVEFGKGVVSGIQQSLEWADKKFGGIITKIKGFLGIDSGPWSKDLIKNAKMVGEAVGKIGMAVFATWGAFKLLGGAKSLLSKIPFIGKFFGGGGGSSGPSGNASDPIYVRMVDKFINMPSISDKILGSGTLGEIFTNPKGMMAGLMNVLKGAFTSLGGMIARLIPSLSGLSAAAIASRAGLWGLAAAAGAAIGYLIAQGINAVAGEWLDKKFDQVAGLFGVEGSSADTERKLAIQNSPAYKQLIAAGFAAGEVPGMNESITTAGVIGKLPAENQELAIAKARRGLFERKFGDQSKLGIGANQTISSVPMMPSLETFKQEQITRTMEMLDKDASSRMESAFKRAMADEKITKEEWVQIYKAGMDQSKVTKNTEKGAEKPDHSQAKVKRGC